MNRSPKLPDVLIVRVFGLQVGAQGRTAIFAVILLTGRMLGLI